MIWIPSWLGEWADRNGNFRNFPVFAAFSALLFLVFTTSHAGLPRRSETKEGAAPRVGGFVFNFFRLNTANCKLNTALRAAVCASALGFALEALQLLLPNRHADPMDLLWMTLGAFAGAVGAGFASTLLPARSI
ncbi:MAG: VanZ family protein [Chthoniobacterales bacterium]